MTVNVLGTEYTITFKRYDEDPDFREKDCNGYCDGNLRQIVVCKMATYPGFETEPSDYLEAGERQVLRHEIVHAFFNESGLADSAGTYTSAWPKNEEMVDWIAIQGAKIYAAWASVHAL